MFQVATINIFRITYNNNPVVNIVRIIEIRLITELLLNTIM